MDKLLSIIVPTYNMERYLDRCLSSLLVTKQTLLNTLEVLVINDGSKDTSSDIGHRYQDENPNVFRVIDKENGNYGSCINRGLKEAVGKYVKVLDADDCFDTVSLELFLELLMNIDADVIFSNYTVVSYKGNPLYVKEMDHSLPLNVYLQFDEKNAYILGQDMQMHFITYKTRNLREISYFQTEGISYTDTEWRFTPMSTVRTIYVTSLNLYNYYIGRENQTMNRKILSGKMDDFIKIMEYLLDTTERYIGDNAHRLYYHLQLMWFLKYLYSGGLIQNLFKESDLRRLDAALKAKSLKYYDEMDSAVFYDTQYQYIRHWRMGRAFYRYTLKTTGFCGVMKTLYGASFLFLLTRLHMIKDFKSQF